jgi:hypothetical protein
MKPEDTLQFMMDFYPTIFFNRQKCLDHLFCTIGNGYAWRNGELVDIFTDEYLLRWGLLHPIKKAKQSEFCYQNESMDKMYIRKFEETGKKYRRWYPLSEYSKILNLPKNITQEWLELAKECKEMLAKDNIFVSLDILP